MNNREAIEVIKANYPTSGFEELREGLDLAIKALEQIGKAIKDVGSLTNNYNCTGTRKHYPECEADITKCKGWGWKTYEEENGIKSDLYQLWE